MRHKIFFRDIFLINFLKLYIKKKYLSHSFTILFDFVVSYRE